MLTSVLQDSLLHNPLACQEGTRENHFFPGCLVLLKVILAEARVGPLFYAHDILMACCLSRGLACGHKCSLG